MRLYYAKSIAAHTNGALQFSVFNDATIITFTMFTDHPLRWILTLIDEAKQSSKT